VEQENEDERKIFIAPKGGKVILRALGAFLKQAVLFQKKRACVGEMDEIKVKKTAGVFAGNGGGYTRRV
jgi:hypothetical protein